MKSVQQLLDKLLGSDPGGKTLVIKERKRRVAGLARFTSRNCPDIQYFKMAFGDHSSLVVLPQEQEIYYSDSPLGVAKGIDDEMVGKDQFIEFNGKTYKLENRNDYQYCLQVYAGVPSKDIEGECRFSDYFSTHGVKEMLSLGWLVETGERADVLSLLIDLQEVTLG